MILTKKPDDTAALLAAPDAQRNSDYSEVLDARLIALNVPEGRLLEARRVMQDGAFWYAGQFVRQLLRSVEGTPAGEALQIAILGADTNLTDAARISGTSKQALSMAVKRVKKRIHKMGRLTA